MSNPQTVKMNVSAPLLAQLVLLQELTHAFAYPLTVYSYAPARQIACRWQAKGTLSSKLYWPTAFASSLHTETKTTQQHESPRKRICIGIVGGGIAGVSVARGLAKRLLPSEAYDIVVFEEDAHGGATQHDKNARPQWIAATARNANSLVPGAAMHVFSRSSVIWDVIQDTISEWTLRQRGKLQPLFMFGSHSHTPKDAFAVKPPYFALHLFRCLGPSASSEERWSFVRFLSNFFYSALWLGNTAADARGRHLCELARANRAIYLTEVAKHKDLQGSQSQGFLNLFRDLGAANRALQEAIEHGEEAEMIDWETAIQREPYLQNIPISSPLYVVYRPNDFTASCETFVRHWIQEITRQGVRYNTSKIRQLMEHDQTNTKDGPKRLQYTVVADDGSETACDVLVLAAGVSTPLLASQLGIEKYCPTYPLRGFSLTMFSKADRSHTSKKLLLQHPFTIDAMYCSSVTSSMVRLAGFGELVGYRHAAAAAASAGPSVLVRYATAIFPDAAAGPISVATEESSSRSSVVPLPCFRPLSPDDLPLAGEVESKPNLFLHTGHGTLGWTVGLASGDCVAQAIVAKLNDETNDADITSDDSFSLPNDIKIARSVLSPNRFL